MVKNLTIPVNNSQYTSLRSKLKETSSINQGIQLSRLKTLDDSFRHVAYKGISVEAFCKELQNYINGSGYKNNYIEMTERYIQKALREPTGKGLEGLNTYMTKITGNEPGYKKYHAGTLNSYIVKALVTEPDPSVVDRATSSLIENHHLVPVIESLSAGTRDAPLVFKLLNPPFSTRLISNNERPGPHESGIFYDLVSKAVPERLRETFEDEYIFLREGIIHRQAKAAKARAKKTGDSDIIQTVKENIRTLRDHQYDPYYYNPMEEVPYHTIRPLNDDMAQDTFEAFTREVQEKMKPQ